MQNLYPEMNRIANYYNDKSNCVLISVAITTLTPYSEVYDFTKKLGRKHGTSPGFDGLDKCIKHFSDNPKASKRIYIKDVFGRETITVSKIGDYLPKGNYICYTSAHVFALVDGQVNDWSAGSKRRVKFYYKIS